MNMTGRRYIAYGSNLNRGQMALRCPDAKVVGTGEIKDYELLFRGNRNGAVATVEPKKGESVPVLIWEISPRDEFNLDRYEGYPRLYGKEMLEVEMDGKREKMMAYTMTDGYAMGVPSEHYLATIRTGYQEAGFDEDVLMAGVEKSRERMKQEMEAERMEEAPWSQQLPPGYVLFRRRQCIWHSMEGKCRMECLQIIRLMSARCRKVLQSWMPY